MAGEMIVVLGTQKTLEASGASIANASAYVQINASSGIGFMMLRAQTFFQTDVIVVGIVTYAVLGLVTDGVVRLIERRALRWQPGR